MQNCWELTANLQLFHLNGMSGDSRRDGRKKTLAHRGWSSLCHSWQGNLQRCKPSLGVHLAVSKLLWELRAGKREQAIPLCLSFCLSVLKSPSALIRSHIQFLLCPSINPLTLSVLTSSQHSQSHCSHRQATGDTPLLKRAASRSQTDIC